MDHWVFWRPYLYLREYRRGCKRFPAPDAMQSRTFQLAKQRSNAVNANTSPTTRAIRSGGPYTASRTDNAFAPVPCIGTGPAPLGVGAGKGTFNCSSRQPRTFSANDGADHAKNVLDPWTRNFGGDRVAATATGGRRSPGVPETLLSATKLYQVPVGVAGERPTLQKTP